MKALRFTCIVALVIALVLVGTGTVLAKGPSEKAQGKGPQYRGEKQGFCGNVTSVQDGNVTLVTEQGWTVTIALSGEFRYKIPKVLNHWEVGDAAEFAGHLEGGSLDSLPGRKVAVLACNVEETAPPGVFSGDALKVMVLPVPGEPLHAHHAGNVTDFNPGPDGNVTIMDVHSVTHTFTVESDTYYRPQGINDTDIAPGSFVTVVSTGQAPAVAKAIVLHKPKPEGWPKPSP
jgi:hypothetical protein